MRKDVNIIIVPLMMLLLAAPAAGAERQPAPPIFILPSQVIPDAVSAGEPTLALGRFLEPTKTGLLVASDRSVSLYTLDQRNLLQPTAVWTLDSPVGAVLGADLDGDAIDEIITATADDGILEVQRLRGSKRTVLGDRRYLWSPVLSMVSPHTVDGRLLVISARGGPIFTYVWRGGAIEPSAVSTDPRLRNLNLRAVGDLDGDDQDEIVATSGFAQVLILRYDKGDWTIAWQNFPWGGISDAAIIDARGEGRPKVLVATHERMAHVFEYTKSGFTLAQQPSELPFGVLDVLTAPSERIAFVTRNSVLLRRAGTIEWRGIDTVTTARVLWPEVELPGAAKPVMVATDINRSLIVYTQLDATPWRIVASLGANRVKPIREMTTGQGHLLISLREVADLLGAKLTWNAESRVASLSWADQSLEFGSLTGTLIRNGEQISDVGPPQVVNGKVYVPVLELDELFGWKTSVNFADSLIEIAL